MGAVLGGKGDGDGSDIEMNVAMQLDPNNSILYIAAAQGYRARGLTAKAVEVLKRAVTVDPENPLAHFTLALMYEHQGDRDKATTEFNETDLLIDTLSLPKSTQHSSNRIINDTHGDTWYRDHFGKEYLLDDKILASLKKKLSKYMTHLLLSSLPRLQ